MDVIFNTNLTLSHGDENVNKILQQSETFKVFRKIFNNDMIKYFHKSCGKSSKAYNFFNSIIFKFYTFFSEFIQVYLRKCIFVNQF